MESKASLFLLEDDDALHETLLEALEDEGYDAVGAYDARTAENLLYERRFDLLLLDVNVPGGDGFSLLKHLRAQAIDTPALFLTTRRGMDDVEQGFESGADDYLRKPFEIKELLLRIKSLLLRRFSHPRASRLELGNGFEYDVHEGMLYRETEPVKLGEKPRRLLQLLLQRRGQVVTHETITAHLWDFDETPSDDALRTYIKELRKIVGKERIVSHKRTGYQFR